ncbi:MAG: hypothetical protein IKA40_01665, partial [Clostridia bacterium]|nr:hypothetical protein [Clostridia bacterium]
ITEEESEVFLKPGGTTSATLDIAEAGTYVIEWTDGAGYPENSLITMNAGTRVYNTTAPYTAFHPMTGSEMTMYKGAVVLWADANTTLTFTNNDPYNTATLNVMYSTAVTTMEFDVYVQEGLTMPGLTVQYNPGYSFEEVDYVLTWDTPLTVYKDQTTSTDDGATGFTFSGVNMMNWLTAYVPSVEGGNAYGHFVLTKSDSAAAATQITLGTTTATVGDTLELDVSENYMSMYVITGISGRGSVSMFNPRFQQYVAVQDLSYFQGGMVAQFKVEGMEGAQISFTISEVNTLQEGENSVPVTVTNYFPDATICGFYGSGTYTLNVAEGETNASIAVWAYDESLYAYVYTVLEDTDLPYTFTVEYDYFFIEVMTSADVMSTTEDTIELTVTAVEAE